MFLKQNISTNACKYMLALLVSSSLCTSCNHSIHSDSWPHGPDVPRYYFDLTTVNIEYLFAGSEESALPGSINYVWISELINHGNEPTVKAELYNASMPNQRYRIQATIALFCLNDEPFTRIESIVDMLLNGSETEKSKIGSLLPQIIVKESDSKYIPLLLELLNCNDPKVRIIVLETIKNFPNMAGVKTSIFASVNDVDSSVRYEAASVLYIITKQDKDYIDNDDGHQAISQLIYNNGWDGGLGWAIRAAALCLDDPFYTSILHEFWENNSDPAVRMVFLDSLSDSTNREIALPLLRLGLDDSDPTVRHRTKEILGITKWRKIAIGLAIIFAIVMLTGIFTFYYQKIIKGKSKRDGIIHDIRF